MFICLFICFFFYFFPPPPPPRPPNASLRAAIKSAKCVAEAANFTSMFLVPAASQKLAYSENNLGGHSCHELEMSAVCIYLPIKPPKVG